MTAQIIPFDFEEQAVRVIMRGEDPWFVAADVCRVLGIVNSRDAVARLDDDERATINLNSVGKTDANRGNPNATIISESGLYALVLRSNGATTPGTVQHRFRKWVTAEVLPSIRKTGAYVAPGMDAPASDIDDMPDRETGLWLSLVREARILGGSDAGRRMWARSPLPPLDPSRTRTAARADDGAACLRHILQFELDGVTIDDWLGIPTRDAHRALGRMGLRSFPANRLFVSNQPPGALFHGSRWAGGLHRDALRAIPGAEIPQHSRHFQGQRARGVIVPVLAAADLRVA